MNPQKKKVQKKKKRMKSKQKSHKVTDRSTASDSRFELNLQTVGHEGDEIGDSFGDLVYDEGDVDSGPGILQREFPKYPPKAVELGVEGKVELKLTIGITGEVQAIKIISENPQGYGFAASAVECVMKWKFTPAKFKGIPVRCYRYMKLSFQQD